MPVLYIGLLAVTLGAILAGCGSARRTEPVAPPLFLSPQEARGETAFMQACNECHPRGETGLGPSLNDKPLPAFLVRLQVRNGLGAMPAFPEEELPRETLDEIIAYLSAVQDNTPPRETE